MRIITNVILTIVGCAALAVWVGVMAKDAVPVEIPKGRRAMLMVSIKTMRHAWLLAAAPARVMTF